MDRWKYKDIFHKDFGDILGKLHRKTDVSKSEWKYENKKV